LTLEGQAPPPARLIRAGSPPQSIDCRSRPTGPASLVTDRCRDARGTGLVADLARDILYALRAFRRAPLAALTIVATVGLGVSN